MADEETKPQVETAVANPPTLERITSVRVFTDTPPPLQIEVENLATGATDVREYVRRRLRQRDFMLLLESDEWRALESLQPASDEDTSPPPNLKRGREFLTATARLAVMVVKMTIPDLEDEIVDDMDLDTLNAIAAPELGRATNALVGGAVSSKKAEPVAAEPVKAEEEPAS